MTAHSILYDPDCGFCRVCVAVVLRWDRGERLRPVALESPEADALLMGMPKDEQMASWHVVDPAGAVRSAGAAFSPLFRLLPGGAPLARVTDRFPDAANRAYRWVAGHRTALGRTLPASAKRWADRVISESGRGGR
jgi:predicted DCC family thiol-disulfide oxidoreductase YuxK